MGLHNIINPVLLTGSIFISTFLFSCNPKSVNNHEAAEKLSMAEQVFSLTMPKWEHVTTNGQQFEIKIKATEKEVLPDSTYIYLGGYLLMAQKNSSLSFTAVANPKKVGKHNLRVVIYYSDSLTQDLNCPITVLSDIKPKKLKYKLLRTLPHDNTSYTQGLVYYNHTIYEGTGGNHNSKLRKIHPDNGKILKEIKLEDGFFGEGITIIGNKIYQLTYLSKIGFIYDLETFEVLRKFDLQTFEGWGLTNDSKNLISSDGSSILYFYDPEYLTQVDQLDVCNDKGLVTKLNELEYVDGYVWSNVYGESYIVKIDTRSGSVVSVLDLQSLFPKDIPLDMDHVLNGIAYNNDSKTFYVTGKFWPVMHEIRITE